MQKRDDSLNSLGRTLIAIDKPLRADIKEMAAKSNMTMVEYLRSKVEADKAANPQSVFTGIGTSSVTKRDIQGLDNKLEALASMLELVLVNLNKTVDDSDPNRELRELVRIVNAAGIKVGRWFTELNREQGTLIPEI